MYKSNDNDNDDDNDENTNLDYPVESTVSDTVSRYRFMF